MLLLVLMQLVVQQTDAVRRQVSASIVNEPSKRDSPHCESGGVMFLLTN